MIFKGTNIEMNVDSFEIIQATDDWNGGCSFLVRLINEKSILVENFDGFVYENDKWENEDANNFIIQKLTEKRHQT
jgi:hypothetical protein